MQTVSVSSTPLHKLARAGLSQPWQALFWLPRRHVDFSQSVRSDAWASRLGDKVCGEFQVISPPRPDPNNPRFSLTVRDPCGEHRLTVFGALRFSAWRSVRVGQTIRVRGKVGEFNGIPQLNAPELIEREHWGRVVPVYRGLSGVVSSQSVREAVQWALDAPSALEDAVLRIRQAFDGETESAILEKIWAAGSLEDLLRAIHRPDSVARAEWGMRLARRLAVAHIRHQAEKAGRRPFSMESVIRVPEDSVRALFSSLPFPPTQGARSQMSAIEEILKLLAEPYPMDAVLSADVGVGKTLVYALAAAAAQAQGRRVAVLIPNGLLVEQVATEMARMFPQTPVAVVMDGAGRRPRLDLSGNPVLIGTTALISAARKAGWIPDLIVVDEQQKMSQRQREDLRAPHTNLIECSATALPRTLALITHGGKQLIQVAKRHAHQTVHTQVVDASHRQDLMTKLGEVMSAGGQVAFIYPKVAGSGEGDKKSVEEAGRIWERRFPGIVAVLHGKMKPEEKTHIMASVKSGEKRLLVASSIVEIGVTISDLRMLVVVHADRYGCSTLHQMRGRLVRHGGEGWCFLYLPEPVEEETMGRLKLLEATNDGFKLAEMDMDLRGFGDLSRDSESQAGSSATLFTDLRLMPRDFD